jgi:hypothetical protein
VFSNYGVGHPVVVGEFPGAVWGAANDSPVPVGAQDMLYVLYSTYVGWCDIDLSEKMVNAEGEMDAKFKSKTHR